MSSQKPSIAVAHKDYDVRGGGEILAEDMAEGLDAPLVVGHGHTEHEPDEKISTSSRSGPNPNGTAGQPAVACGGHSPT